MKAQKDSKQRWKATDNRFVVFLDIMGFKDMVMRNGHDTIYKKMYNLSEVYSQMSNIVEGVESSIESTLHVTTFSDSIIIFSKNDDHKNLANILIATKIILQYPNSVINSWTQNLVITLNLCHEFTSEKMEPKREGGNPSIC